MIKILNYFLPLVLLFFSCERKVTLLSETTLSEWNLLSLNHIDSLCNDNEKRNLMKRYYKSLKAVQGRQMIFSKFEKELLSRKNEFDVYEELSENNGYYLIYLHQLNSERTYSLKFIFATDAVQEDTIYNSFVSTNEIVCKEVQQKGTACPYLKGSHNPILSMYSAFTFNQDKLIVKNVCLLLQ